MRTYGQNYCFEHLYAQLYWHALGDIDGYKSLSKKNVVYGIIYGRGQNLNLIIKDFFFFFFVGIDKRYIVVVLYIFS